MVLNGPKSSGKDTTAGILLSLLGASVSYMKMSDPVKNGTHKLHGLDVPTDFFENTKDVPLEVFHGATPREAYIAYSERLHKLHGPTVLTDILLNRLSNLAPTQKLALVDAGIPEEVRPILAADTVTNSCVIRIHRPGKTFAGDIRSYLDHPEGRNVDLYNNGSTENLRSALRQGFKDNRFLRESLNGAGLTVLRPQALQTRYSQASALP